MSWLIHRWLFLYGISLLVFKDCQGFFLRHTQSGKCIAAGTLIWEDECARRYWATMVNNCLKASAQFRYLDAELIYNIAKGGTLASNYDCTGRSRYNNRLFIFDATEKAKSFENSDKHRLKQTAAGFLFLYDSTVNSYAQPNEEDYVDQKKDGCRNAAEQKFTFGSVTQYGTKMKDVRCSPIQRMVVKKAYYGNFNNSGTFDGSATNDTQCSAVTSCKVKSLCGGNKSCELTIDNNVLLSHLCPDTTKELYTKYTCVDTGTYTSPITTAPKIRLSSASKGYIYVYDGSSWRKVNEENWDKNRETMLCKHLGFQETGKNIVSGAARRGEKIVTGDLVCYNTQSSGTSCCVHLQPTTATSSDRMPYARCKICDQQLLINTGIFPDSIFSGDGSSNYEGARFTRSGWCTSKSGSYLLIDLQKEYHIIRVVIMGNRDQTKWCGSYSFKYSHDKTYQNSEKITGNSNGDQPFINTVKIYNARYIKIESTGCQDFCLRIELCGEVQTPAPVYDVQITPLKNSASVTLRIQTSASASSYITKLDIYLNSKYHQTVYRGSHNQFYINNLKPYTDYTVGILAGDGNSQYSTIKDIKFKTKGAAPSGSPRNVVFTSRSKNSLEIAWIAPNRSSWNAGELTGYQVCYSTQARSNHPRCTAKLIKASPYTINGLRPSTKYFLTVSTVTNGGVGPKSTEISKITNGEPVDVVVMSYSNLSLTITKPATYIREVMVIVQNATSSPTPSENIETSKLKPYQKNTQDPYITAYLKADVLPLTFVIGDGKMYKSEKEIYFNQPLIRNSSYIVFLRFFVTQNSYYSTEWSSSIRPSRPPLDVSLTSRGKTSLEVSWEAPDKSSRYGELTGYQVCFNTRDTAPECKSIQNLSLTINNLQPSTKYFVTVSASTNVGYGERSLEVSKITNGEPVNPLTTSYYTLSLNIPKPAEYIREVMVIIQSAISSPIRSGNIQANKLKTYQTNTQDPYITAYLKADVLPLTFVIGDGKKYNSEKEKYSNQPLKQNTSYNVFLIFFESQDSYYSTERSSSVKTMVKPPVESNKNSEQSTEDKIRMDLLIPLAILALCFLLLLGVIIYKRRCFQNRNRETSHKLQTLRQVDQKGKFDSIPEPPSSDISMNVIQAAPNDSLVQNDDTEYEVADFVIKRVGRNEAESTPDITTGQESATYMSLNDNREPESFYQPLQTLGTSADVHRTKKGDDQSSTYMSLKDNREPPNFYEPLRPPGTSADPYHIRRGVMLT